MVRKRRFNTSVVIAPSGEIVLKYRKVHLPGHKEFSTIRKVQHLEKRYFEVGNLGFPVVRAPVGQVDGVNLGMLICNDRRWPESWRELGLQQVELVMLGYNTPAVNQENRGFEAHHLRNFHSQLSIQAGCYQNATFGVGVAKAGNEDGFELMGHSIIVNPQGEIRPWPPAGTTSWWWPTATWTCASWAATPSSTSPSTAAWRPTPASPARPAAPSPPVWQPA